MTSTMELLHNLVGRERSLREVAQVICFWAQRQNAAAVGALHVTCSDESERECAEAFQQGFVQYMLPSLKFARHSAFQLSNLGGVMNGVRRGSPKGTLRHATHEPATRS